MNLGLLTLWPWLLTFEVQNSTTSSLCELWTLWVLSCLSYATDKQTNKQTDSNILSTSTDIVGVDNYCVVLLGAENDVRQQLGATSGRMRDDGKRDGDMFRQDWNPDDQPHDRRAELHRRYQPMTKRSFFHDVRVWYYILVWPYVNAGIQTCLYAATRYLDCDLHDTECHASKTWAARLKHEDDDEDKDKNENEENDKEKDKDEDKDKTNIIKDKPLKFSRPRSRA